MPSEGQGFTLFENIQYQMYKDNEDKSFLYHSTFLEIQKEAKNPFEIIIIQIIITYRNKEFKKQRSSILNYKYKRLGYHQ